ncbi:hypothetical protein LXL04_020401 [Taraxacum kok-saghyz]
MTKSLFIRSCERYKDVLDLAHPNIIKFNDYHRDCDIVSKLTPSRTPQVNGVAERRNQTFFITDLILGYAHESDTHILNRVQTKKVSKTLSKCGAGKFPHSSTLRYGILRHSLYAIPRTILSPDPKDVGLSVIHKIALDIYFSDPLKGARKGMFLERDMMSQGVSGRLIDLEEIRESTDNKPIVDTSVQPEVEQPVESVDDSLPLRRTSRVSNPPQFSGFHITAGGDTLIGDKTLINMDEPSDYKEAMAGPEDAQWIEAMDSEIQSMKDNQVWNLVEPTPSLETVGCCRWIFK